MGGRPGMRQAFASRFNSASELRAQPASVERRRSRARRSSRTCRTGRGKPALAVRDSSDAVRRCPGDGCRDAMQTSRTAAVDLYWIPLGAGGHSVRFNGRVVEAIEAAFEHRQRCDLYHAALVVELDGERYTIEMAPSPNADEASRGVVATGAVGSRYVGWLRLFRYEVRCWRGGSIPDLDWAVGGPRRLTSDPRVARRLIDRVTTVPTPVWGRDELKAGEMWNSNSMIAWLISTAGLSTHSLRPPSRGRAPGWGAGLEVARRSDAYEGDTPTLGTHHRHALRRRDPSDGARILEAGQLGVGGPGTTFAAVASRGCGVSSVAGSWRRDRMSSLR